MAGARVDQGPAKADAVSSRAPDGCAVVNIKALTTARNVLREHESTLVAAFDEVGLEAAVFTDVLRALGLIIEDDFRSRETRGGS